MIGTSDSESAEINIIHPDVVNFKLNWCNFEVARTRLVIETTQDNSFELIRDLIVGTFRLLAFTPINMLGLNTEMHYRAKDIKEWHAFGHKLIPKDPFWSALKNPGTISAHVQGERPDNYDGYLRVEAGLSTEVQPGISVRVNDHYTVNEATSIAGCGKLIDIIEAEWENAHERAKNIINTVINTH